MQERDSQGRRSISPHNSYLENENVIITFFCYNHAFGFTNDLWTDFS